MKRKLCFIIPIAILFISSCSNVTTVENITKEIKITSDKTSLSVNENLTLNASFLDNSNPGKISWSYDTSIFDVVSSTDTSITLKAIKSGTTVIQACLCDSNIKKSITIKIEDLLPPPLNPFFNEIEKQDIGFDDNPLYSKDYLNKIIRNYTYNGGALRDKPKPFVDFNVNDSKIILSPKYDNEYKLSLLDTNTGKEITNDNIEWFIVQSYPWDNIFDKNESNTISSCPIKIESTNNNATVKIRGKKTENYNTEYQTFGDIVAVVDGKYIHRKAFYVLNEKEDNKQDTHNKINDVITSMISPMWGLSDVEKALYLQATVDLNLTYDMDYLRKPTYENLFLTKRAVCEGYAKMYARLARELGMKVREDIDATTANHAWNRIWIDDGFYYVDTTWDDDDASNDYLLYYFLMPVDQFEITHPRTKLAYKDKHFGYKHLNEGENSQKYLEMKKNGIPQLDINTVSEKPDLSKIHFIGDGINSGYIITEETNLEYTTGFDGVWHKIIPKVKNNISNIVMENESYYDPQENLPYYILIRRTEIGKISSEYVKINVFKKYNSPSWIEVTEDKTVHNISTKMEYSTNGASPFIPVTDNTMKLKEGEYYFRLKGGENNLPSETVKIIVQ